MTNISFREKAAVQLDEQCFENLEGVSRQLFSTLQLNRDEAGFLDKKLPPELVAYTAKALEMLKERDSRAEAERFLQVDLPTRYSASDVLIAVLRQNFRVDIEASPRWLVNFLTNLVEIDKSGIARKAVLEAAGSEIRSLALLADEVSLHIADPNDLARLVTDSFCSATIRIKAARKLIAAQDMRGLAAVWQLIEAYWNNPNLYQWLVEMIKSFGAFREVGGATVEKEIVKPVLGMLKSNERDQNQRRKLLERIIDELPVAFLDSLQQLDPGRLDYNNWFFAPVALGRCARHSADAVNLLIEWAEMADASDSFRAECCIRLADDKTLRPPTFVAQVNHLRELLRYDLHKQGAKEKALGALDKALGTKDKTPLSIEEMYDTLFEAWDESGALENQVAWEFGNKRGVESFIERRLPQMSEEELHFIIDLVSDDRLRRMQPGRLTALALVILAFARTRTKPVYHTLLSAASQLATHDPIRKQAVEFLVNRINANESDSLTAQQCWQRLAQQ